MIENIGVVWRNQDWRGPLETVFDVRGAPAHGVFRVRSNFLGLLGALVEARDMAAIAARVNNIGIAGIDGDVAALAPAHGIPLRPVDHAGIAAAGNSHRGVVLLRAVDVVGITIVGSHVIKLRGGLIVLARPTLSAVHADSGAAIVAFDHPLRI